jgi:hypothetical protein
MRVLKRAVSIFLMVLGMQGATGCVFYGGEAALRRKTATGVSLSEGPVEHIPLPPENLEQLLAHEEIWVRSESPAGSGVTGAFKDVLFFPAHDIEVTVKWRPVPRGDADGWNNSPRKELAAYAVQKLFLDPVDYVVPTLAARCVSLDRYHERHPAMKPTLDDTRCVLVVAAIWLDNVRVPETLYDPDEFAADPRYAYHLANFNVLSYLIDHRDGRDGNILTSVDPANRRVFAVDNGISFGPKIYNVFVQNWHTIRVPALPKESVDRLRGVTGTDLERLGVLLQMQVDRRGLLQHVPADPNLDPSKGSRASGDMIQLGLTESEIDDVHRRIQKVIDLVDSGKLAVF